MRVFCTEQERNALRAAIGCRAYVLEKRIARYEQEGKLRPAQSHREELVLITRMKAELKEDDNVILLPHGASHGG